MMPAATDPITVQFVYMIGSFGAGVAFLTWFIANQFSHNRRIFYRVISLHNKEDDDRFQELSDEIWRIHLRNARRDGDREPDRKTFPRRGYLQEAADNGELGGGPFQPA